MPRAKILLIDHEVPWTLKLSELLIRDNCEMFSANTVQDANLLLDAHSIDVVIAEINMPGAGGMTFLEQIRQVYPEATVVVHTNKTTVEQAVAATKLGVFDYLQKSDDPAALTKLRERVLQAIAEISTLIRSAVSDPRSRGLLASPVQGFYGIISQNARMRDIFELIQTIADSYANVLIHGETGTGKELVARTIHERSGRAAGPFVTLNCAAVPAELIESELFGHEKGSFTGAVAQKIGRFELADHGTLFLDEIGEMPLELQPKLLRAIQDQEFERVGGNRTIRTNVRFVAATNRDLKAMVDENRFRADLYYRLHVFPLNVPPLRERREDIPLLTRYFVQKHAHRLDRRIERIPTQALEALVNYDWPGNIRELQNVIERSVILSNGSELRVDLPEMTGAASPPAHRGRRVSHSADAAERARILQALKEANGIVGGPEGAAARLGLKRTTLQSRMRKYNIGRLYQ